MDRYTALRTLTTPHRRLDCPPDSFILTTRIPGEIQPSCYTDNSFARLISSSSSSKVLSTQHLAYLYNLISYHQPSRSLRFSSQSLFQVPRVKTDFGRRAFSSAAPQIWNHIPAAIKVSPSLDSFKRHLKTHYITSP